VFGNNELALLDYRLVGPLRHGATLRLYLQWQASDQSTTTIQSLCMRSTPAAKNGAGGQQTTRRGSPTYKLTPGQVISDTHTIQIDVEGPSEDYHLEVGLYLGATGERVLMDGGQDHLVLLDRETLSGHQ